MWTKIVWPDQLKTLEIKSLILFYDGNLMPSEDLELNVRNNLAYEITAVDGDTIELALIISDQLAAQGTPVSNLRKTIDEIVHESKWYLFSMA